MRIPHFVRMGARRFLPGAARLFSAVLAMYFLLWSSLYYCTPMIDASEPSPSELYAFCYELIDSLNSIHLYAASEYPSFSGIAREARSLMSNFTGQALSVPKAARYPELFNALGIAGVYFPFTFESIVNVDDICPSVPFTACHELAHQAGWAREEEASLVAWLACSQGSPAFRYSGDFAMLISAMKLLRAENRIWWERCVDQMIPGVLYDFRLANGLNEAIPSRLRRIQDCLSDFFLRMNGQKSGLSGYDRAVWLAIAWRKADLQSVLR